MIANGGNMKRLPCSYVSQYRCSFWQLFYIACYSQLIFKTMKNYIKSKMIDLPRSFRVWWGKCFLYMLGKIGTHEFNDDIILYNELKRWVDTKGKPTTPFI